MIKATPANMTKAEMTTETTFKSTMTEMAPLSSPAVELPAPVVAPVASWFFRVRELQIAELARNGDGMRLPWGGLS